MLGLGRLYDLGTLVAPVDLATAGITGKRISMTNCQGVDIVLFYGAGNAADNPVPSLQQHTAYTGGTSANLAVIDTFYTKNETLLDNDEPWVKRTQTAATIITGVTGHGATEKIYVFHVTSASLSDGYTHISVNQADPGANSQLVAGLYIKVGLQDQRTPAALPNLLAPGLANA
jgi:hypothetical protein